MELPPLILLALQIGLELAQELPSSGASYDLMSSSIACIIYQFIYGKYNIIYIPVMMGAKMVWQAVCSESH